MTADQDRKDRQARFYVLLGVGILLAGLALFTYASSEDDSNKAELDGQLCLLEELQKHRVNDYDAHRDEAAAEGRPFNVPEDEPVFDSRLNGACERFISAR